MYQSSVPSTLRIELCPVPRMPCEASFSRITPRYVHGPSMLSDVAYPTR
ncbi:Uncharacterised protein [Mycobacteroides abscessus]|nr:Uncharacterised protein [Mycobacteroides abscessus]